MAASDRRRRKSRRGRIDRQCEEQSFSPRPGQSCMRPGAGSTGAAEQAMTSRSRRLSGISVIIRLRSISQGWWGGRRTKRTREAAADGASRRTRRWAPPAPAPPTNAPSPPPDPVSLPTNARRHGGRGLAHGATPAGWGSASGTDPKSAKNASRRPWAGFRLDPRTTALTSRRCFRAEPS